ncbi:MAG TPA: hypothetical protein ENJ61_01470 [Aquifex aeolicus]|uniref:Uncharacterized protein n=1 Tax=Aquifex aeolicus TaxID=63363 RepID=A0A7C5Q7Q6_AQUAO|nr:hypothetical protein [Aquifex aeolicus]
MPVVDLLPILELNEWIEGFTLFKNYGDGNFLAEFIERKLSEFDPEQRRKAGKLSTLPKLLRKYSQAVGFTALDFIPSSASQVAKIMNELEDPPVDLSAVDLLRNSFRKTCEEVEKRHPEEWRNQYQLTRWLFHKRRYSQATIALEECIFSYVLENTGFNVLDEVRRRLGDAFREDREKNVFFTPALNSLFSKIQDLRNKTGHAFMQKEAGEGDIKDAIDKLERYIEETQKVLNEGGIRNREALIDYMKSRLSARKNPQL